MKSIFVFPKISYLLIVLGISSAMICLSQVSLDSASSQEVPESDNSAPKPNVGNVRDPRLDAVDKQLEASNNQDQARKEEAEKRVQENNARSAAAYSEYDRQKAAFEANEKKIAQTPAQGSQSPAQGSQSSASIEYRPIGTTPSVVYIEPEEPPLPIPPNPIPPNPISPNNPIKPVKLALQDIASFSCSESEPATAAKTKSSNNAPVILWKSAIFKDYSPKTRCEQVSNRFEAYRKILVEGKTPLFITSGKLNKNPVICLTTQEKEGCEEGKLPHNGLLFTLAPFQEPTATKLVENLGNLLDDLRQGKTVHPLES